MPRTLDQAVADANAKGLAIHNLFQMPDGSWRACVKVFGATSDLAMNPVYLNYADGDDPADCIDRAIASSDKIPWKAKAALGVAAMDDMTCFNTLRSKDRPAVEAKKHGHWNRPTTSEAPPLKPKRDILAETEEMLRKKAPEAVAASRRRSTDDKLNDLL